MRKSVKLYLSLACICLGVLLIAGSVALIIRSRYAEEKSRSCSAEILSCLRSSMPEAERSSQRFDMFSAAALSLDGSDYIGILSIPSVNAEFPIASGYEESGIAAYRVSGNDSPLALSCNSESWSNAADASVGDRVIVTDMRGYMYEYAVTEIARENSYIPVSEQSDESLTLVVPSKGAYVIIRCEIE